MFSNLITFLVRCKYFNYFLINFNIYTPTNSYLRLSCAKWHCWEKRPLLLIYFTIHKSLVRALSKYFTVAKSLVLTIVLYGVANGILYERR